MHYQFQQLDVQSCREIAASITSLLVGKVAVSSAFDSGRIHRPNWKHVNGFAITPAITEAFIAQWPLSHDYYCDEWWVFENAVPNDFDVHSFCNFVGTRISDYKELDFDGGCPLDSYLQRFCPAAVFGNNEFGYLVSLQT